MSVQQGRKFSLRALRCGGGKKMAEVQKQSQCVERRQFVARITPLLEKIARLRSGGQKWLQQLCRVVIETEIPRRKLLFQDGHACEQRHRSTLHWVWRLQQNVALSHKECARHPPANVFCKC